MRFLKEQISLLRDFLHTGFRKNVLLCAAGFLAACVIGFLIGVLSPETTEAVIELFLENAENDGVIREDGTISALALLTNNWTAMLISVAYGFIPFMFVPVSSLIMNGFILGISGAMYHIYDQALAIWLAALLPHGILELPALVLAVACGIHLCISINRIVIESPRRTPMVDTLSDLLRVIMLLIAPMIIAAAYIEVYITPLFMALFI